MRHFNLAVGFIDKIIEWVKAKKKKNGRNKNLEARFPLGTTHTSGFELKNSFILNPLQYLKCCSRYESEPLLRIGIHSMANGYEMQGYESGEVKVFIDFSNFLFCLDMFSRALSAASNTYSYLPKSRCRINLRIFFFSVLIQSCNNKSKLK